MSAVAGFAARCSPFVSRASMRQAFSNVSLRESGHFPSATDFASRSRFCGFRSSRSTPRFRAAAMNPSPSSTRWFLTRMSLMSRSDRGSRRTTTTDPSGETFSNPSLSFAASQSAHRHDSRKRGRPRPSSFLRTSSSGVRPSSVPARDSSSPSRNKVTPCHSGSSSKVRKSRTVTYTAPSPAASFLNAVVLPAPGSAIRTYAAAPA